MTGWKFQRQFGDYWLVGIWMSKDEGRMGTTRQITVGLGRWKIQAVKVVPRDRG